MKVFSFRRARLLCFVGVFSSTAQSTNDLPELIPPYAALPPTFWEQYGSTLVITSLLGAVVIGVLVWLISRPRPAPVLPPEVQARRELEALSAQTQTGEVLSRVSQILRRYISTAFALPAGELTTQELISAMQSSPTFDGKLRDATRQFLESCDSRKFAPTQIAPPQDVASLALALIKQSESVRAARTAAADRQSA